MSIYYCCECDTYYMEESGIEFFSDCGEQAIELSESDILIKLEYMQCVINENI